MDRATYYVTTAANHPRGSGYWEVAAHTKEQAHARAMDALDGKWSMMYERLEDIHPLDRKRHGRIG
jgi:hypothetical protein